MPLGALKRAVAPAPSAVPLRSRASGECADEPVARDPTDHAGNSVGDVDRAGAVERDSRRLIESRLGTETIVMPPDVCLSGERRDLAGGSDLAYGGGR